VKLNDEGGPATIRNTKAMVRAQNDIYMVVENAQNNSTNDNTRESLENGLLMRGELQRSARNICNVLLQSEAFRRLLRGEQILTQASSAFSQTQSHLIKIDKNTEIFLDGVDTSAGNEKSLELDVISGGEYTLAFTLVSNLNPLAQLPINVLINDQFSSTFVFNGTDGQFTTREKQLNLETGALKLTFAFPQSGLKIQRLRFIKR